VIFGAKFFSLCPHRRKQALEDIYDCVADLVAGAELIKRGTVTLPASVQYAWPHVSRRYLYVATSNSASGYGAAGTEHHVNVFAMTQRAAR
jgi:hypothetical protein